MPISGLYFDLASSLNIEGVLIRNNGNEIAFDLDVEGYVYTVSLRRIRGTLFDGTAKNPDGYTADVTCRVYEDREQGITILVGSIWREVGTNINERWFIELEHD